MRYTLEMTGAAATIGYLSCQPEKEMTEQEAICYLEEHPLDDFMHKYVLMRILQMEVAEIEQLAKEFDASSVVATLLAEAALQRKELANLVPEQVRRSSSPLVDLRQEEFEDMDLHRKWSRLLVDNLLEHAPFPERSQRPKLPFSSEELEQAGSDFVSVEKFADSAPTPEVSASSLDEVVRTAEAALAAAGVKMERQMLHQSSLSPVGLVREWHVKVEVKTGSLNYQLSGSQTSFGRGMQFDVAQTGLLMEICERFSSWANIGEEGAVGYVQPLPFIRERYSRLQQAAIDPASLPLEVPVRDEVLHWVPGVRPDGSQILVPAQFIFLFANFEEPALCSGLGSTGLGAGLDMERARVTALQEIIERDAESVTPHSLSRCFRITSGDETISNLLAEYAKRKIEVFFEDISSELGVPCYRAFAVGPEGQVTKGASAGLNGPEACISAMLEVPYPYPWGPPSRPAPNNIPMRVVEELPNYSTGTFAGDLVILESALTASGRTPAYINLTREDMRIPVCRAVVPGLELMADFDNHSRFSPRLFGNILQETST